MMRPFRPTRINKRSVYVNKDLFETKFVFVRNDAHRPPLTPSYRGPYLALRRQGKVFQLDLSGRKDWVTVDRLKPAYVDATDVGLHQTLSGRIVHPPAFFQAS